MSPKRILIQNPLVCATMNDRREEFSGGHILLEDGVITSIGPEEFTGTADETIDARAMVVLPGFINTHHHLYQSLTRNIPRMQNSPLFSWLTDHYQVWREIDAEAIDVSARVGLLELMLSGVTTSSDHLYLFPHQTTGELIDVEIEAARDLGIRFQPTRGSMSLGASEGGLPPDDVVQSEAVITADTRRLLAQYHDDQPGAMTRISLAPCSPFSVTPELMKSTAELAREAGVQIHTHLAETLDEENFCLDRFGVRPVAYADQLGWLTSNAWYAHAVHLNDQEIDAMGAAGAGISHCPSSNMRLGSGIARIKELLNVGVKVSLGVDGSASNDSGNMLMEMRNALFLSRLRESDDWLTARDVLWMATRGGAAVLGRDDIGELSVGKQADLALFRMDRLEYAGGQSDPLAALLFSVRTAPVDWLFIQGRAQVRQGKLSVDMESLIQRHNEVAQALLRRSEKRTGIHFGDFS